MRRGATATDACVDRQTARRFVLYRHGVWPGRHHAGQAGIESAIRQSEGIQIDTISIVARSHDLALHSRVKGYDPSHLYPTVYGTRKFFDYGAILMFYPFEELPYWQAVMARRREHATRYLERIRGAADLVLNEISSRGPLTSRSFTDRSRVAAGWGQMKDTAHAIRLLHAGGWIMTHSRVGFDRAYDLFERVAGCEFDATRRSIEESEHALGLKALRDLGIATSAEWSRRASLILNRKVMAGEAREWMTTRLAEGVVTPVAREGCTDTSYVLTADLGLIHTLASGSVPAGGRGSATSREVRFLAPLDSVVWDRARTRSLFEFDYVWEVYKPAELRRWGYYTLPMLFGDRLVGRLSPRLHRKEKTLHIDGLWLEDDSLAGDPEFIAAFGDAMREFAQFHGAERTYLPCGATEWLRGFVVDS